MAEYPDDAVALVRLGVGRVADRPEGPSVTQRQLTALFDETLLGEPPVRDLVGGAIRRGRAQKRRAVLLATAGVAAAALLALVVLPVYGPWRDSAEAPVADDEAAAALPDRFLPLPPALADTPLQDPALHVGDPWRAVDDDPNNLTDTSSVDGADPSPIGWTATSFADSVTRLVDVSGAERHGVPLGFDGPPTSALDGTLPARWVETWLSDPTGVTGVWVQQWTLWPSTWAFCTDADAACRTATYGDVRVVSSRVFVPDPVTHRPVLSWVSRASTPHDLMVVVVAGPRTRAGVSSGSSRPQPLLTRDAVEQLARHAAELGY